MNVSGRLLNLSGLLLLACSFLALATGCGQDGIAVYQIPKEPRPLAQANQPATAAAVPQLTWKTPGGWQELPPGEMRVASFKVAGPDGKQADVSVIPLPGSAGGDFSNVNRWRSQVGQPPITAAELDKLAQSVEVAGQPALLYEQNGANPAGEPTRILAAIQHREDTAWFFKMTGDSQLVVREKPAFVAFLKSVQFGAGTAPAASPSAPTTAAASEPRPRWDPPPGWTEVPGGQFLVAKFTMAGAGGGQATVNVSSSAGNGGGLEVNVNRWRKQLGLGDLTGAELAKAAKVVTTASGSAMFVEMAGTDARTQQPAALVGAIVFQPGQAWFYKLMGDAPVVAAQKDALIKFVQEAGH